MAIHRLAAVPLVSLALLLGACGGDKTDSASSTDAKDTTTTMAGHGTVDPECPSYMPGQVLTPEQATVQFDETRVCPGYVTVAPGTLVTFKNTGKKAATITLTKSYQLDSELVDKLTVEPGDIQTFVRDTPMTVYYHPSSVPTFRGEVEIIDPKNPGAGHG